MTAVKMPMATLEWGAELNFRDFQERRRDGGGHVMDRSRDEPFKCQCGAESMSLPHPSGNNTDRLWMSPSVIHRSHSMMKGMFRDF